MNFYFYKNTAKKETAIALAEKIFLGSVKFWNRCIIFLCLSILCTNIYSQSDNSEAKDSVVVFSLDSAGGINFAAAADTLQGDTLQNDSISPKRMSPNAIKEKVKYDAEDSIRFDLKRRKAYLFNKAVVEYEDMVLEADYIEIDFKKNELYASGVADEQGNVHGAPVFTQGEYTFRTQEINYNFATKKGKIWNVITSEGEGYIHGEQVKKLDDNTSFIKKGKYTTCELDDPHFEISFTKAKVVPNEKIITGPAYLSFVGIPTFLAIPFGYFPIHKERKSGIIMPTFGESTNRGFYFENFGFYWGINNNIDLLIAGDIYTRGSWAAKLRSNYVFRYKCKGNFNVSFAQNYFGERGTPSHYHTNDFKIYWDHQQDAKSHPTTRFSAHIDVVSRSYNTYNPSSVNDYLSNQYTSKLNFSTSANGVFYFDATASYSQSTLTGVVDFALPDISMSVNQFYPFRKKNKTGNMKWYDNIALKWSSQLTNKLQTYDSLVMKPETWEECQLGMRHVIPFTIPIKLGKAINWNTTVNFTEKWYLQRTEKLFSTYTDTSTNQPAGRVTDVFKRNFYALHDIDISTALTTKIYVMYQFKKGGLKAIRHVITPNLSFSYNPNLNGKSFGTYYNTITGEEVRYSYFANSIYGGATGKSSAIARLSFGNNLEIKVRSKKDSITGMKKVVIFENISISTYYDFLADSLKWAPLTISGRTTLFKQLYVTFSLSFDPYCYGENGKRINVTELKRNKRLYRFASSDVSVGLNLTINRELFKGKTKDKPAAEVPDANNELFTENSLGMPTRRPDFSNPWSITINYTFAYSTRDNPYYYVNPIYYTVLPDNADKKFTHSIIQTLNVSGDVNITKKWKIGFTTGYDFTQKDLSYTSLDIYRDLHCWEMRFNWIPFGTRKGWSFTINVKASVLQDLKYNMKRDFRDNF